MIRRLIPVALLMGAVSANAQVGIGTKTPNKSAELLIESTNRGLLIPNVALSDVKDKKTITNGNVNSLMVFNTTSNDNIQPGYYYWYIDTWNLLTSDSDIPSIVVNNFQEILNLQDNKVENLIKQIVLNTQGNVIYQGDKLYYINQEGNKVEIDFGNIVQANETLTKIEYNQDTHILSYVDEHGKITPIALNSGEIKYDSDNNRMSYLASDGKISHINLNNTGLKYDSKNHILVYTDSKGATHNIELQDLVSNFETVTTLTALGNGKYEYVSEDGTQTLIDIPLSVVENFQSIVNQGPVTINGVKYTTIEQYIKDIANSSVTVDGSDFIEVSGDGTSDDPYHVTIKEGDKNSLLITNEKGELEWATIDSIVKNNETVTTLTALGNGKYEYVSEDGTQTLIDIPLSVVENFQSVVNQGPVTINGVKYTTIEQYIKDIANSSVTVNGSDFIEVSGDGTSDDPYHVTIKKGDKNSMLITNEEGELEWATIDSIVKNNETITTLTALGNGKYEYVSEDGTQTLIDIPLSVVENFQSVVNQGPVTINGVKYTTIEQYIKDIANSSVTVDGSDFIEVSGDGTSDDPYHVTIKKGDKNSMLITNEEGELEWATIDSIVKNNETITTLTALGNGKYEYVSEDGTQTLIDIPLSVVENFQSIVNQGPVTINGVKYTTIEQYIKDIANSSVTVSGSDFIEVSGDGTSDDPYHVTIKKGDKNSMLITNEEGELEWATIDSIVKNNETITTLTALGNGKYEYVSEDGTQTLIDIPLSVVENFQSIVNQGPVTINGVKYTTIEQYIKDIANSSVTVSGSDFIEVSGDGTSDDPYHVTIKKGDKNSMLITNEEGELEWATIDSIVKNNETITTLTALGNGKYEYVSEDGTQTLIDIPLSVVENFQSIVNQGPVTINGVKYTTIEQYIKDIANSSVTVSGSDFIEVSGDGTSDDPYHVTIKKGDKNSMLITNEEGELEWATIDRIVKNNETITTLTALGNGKYEYVSEDGTQTLIDIPLSVVENFENIVNQGPVTINGVKYTTIEQYIKDIANSSVTVSGSDFIEVSGDGTSDDPYHVTIKKGDKNSMLITNEEGELEWATIDSIVPNITNLLVSSGNTLSSTVSGVVSDTSIVNEISVSVNEHNQLVTSVNNQVSNPLDLTGAVQGLQKTTTVTSGNNVSVESIIENNNTDYTISVSDLQGDITGGITSNSISKIQGTPVMTDNKKDGEVLMFNGESWVAGSPNIGVDQITNSQSLSTDGVIIFGQDDEDNDITISEKTVLKAAKLSIKHESITSDLIQDNTIQPQDIKQADKNQVLVTDKEGNPTWKNQNKVAPQFFYMPAVIFDTSKTGEAKRDLYQEYVNQFTGGKIGEGGASYPISHGPSGTTPISYSGGIIGSQGAPADISVFESNELYYYVTYYDQDVFEKLEISEDGKLTYTVKSSAKPSSYMNIVFVIK